MIATKNQIAALQTLASGTDAARLALNTRTVSSLIRRYFAAFNYETGRVEATSIGRNLIAQQARYRYQAGR